MVAQHTISSVLNSLFAGVDGRRVALLGVAVVLALLLWRKLRDTLIVGVVFAAVLLTRAGDDPQGAPAAAEPSPAPEHRPALVLV